MCDTNFLGWPYIATPQDILDELGSKSLEDFEEECASAGWEQAGVRWSSRPENALRVEVKEFYYQDLTADGMVVSAYPRRYLAEVGLTNRSEQPIYVKSMSVTVQSEVRT